MTAVARPLLDDVPGNIGLLADASEVVRLRLSEPAGVMPSDVAGGLLDLAPPSAHVAPVSVDSWTGKGREFAPSAPSALIAIDAATADTLATRDATIVALLSLNLADGVGPMTVYCRGIGGSSAEYYGLGLELENQGGGNHGKVDVRMFWATAAGALATQAAGTFQWPGDGVPFLLTATREWVSTTEVVVRYYVDEQLIAEVISTDGDIGGGTTGTTSIGARRTTGTWGRYFAGVIDELQVLGRALCAEEVATLWARLVRHQPEGVERLKALSPPGAPWFVDRGSRIARLGKSVGQGLGVAAAKTDEVARTFLPDRSSEAAIVRWESLLGVAPRGADRLQTRRDRVVGLLQRENGYSVPKIQEALATSFDQAAVDVDIVEFTAEVADTFTTLSSERWHAEPAARWSISGGRLRLAALAADDARWDATARSAMHLRTPLYSASGGENRQASARLGFVAQINVVDYTIANPSDVLVGLFLYNFRTGKAFWFGVWNNAGAYDIAHATFDGSVSTGFTAGLTELASNIGTANLRLRIRASDTDASAITLEWGIGAASFDAAFASASITLDIEPDYVGIGALDEVAGFSGNLTVDFDDFLVRSPRGERAFHWYAMQDGSGSPDMIGAQRLIERLKPAHTHAAAISSLSLLCDDPASGCGRGPMGGV